MSIVCSYKLKISFRDGSEPQKSMPNQIHAFPATEILCSRFWIQAYLTPFNYQKSFASYLGSSLITLLMCSLYEKDPRFFGNVFHITGLEVALMQETSISQTSDIWINFFFRLNLVVPTDQRVKCEIWFTQQGQTPIQLCARAHSSHFAAHFYGSHGKPFGITALYPKSTCVRQCTDMKKQSLPQRCHS